MQGIVIQLGSTEKELQMAYNKMATLNQGILKEKATQDSLRVELFFVKVEYQNSHARLKALRNSLEEFNDFFEGFTTLTEIVKDKIFIAMSNMYFFNQSKGMQVDSVLSSIMFVCLILQMCSLLRPQLLNIRNILLRSLA